VRQSIRAIVALALGILVGLSASEPEILVAVAAIILLVFVTASLRRPDPLVFFAFVLLAMPKLNVPGSPLPLGETIMLLAVLSAFLTLKEGLHPLPRWARLTLGAFVATLVLSSAVNGLFTYDSFKRLLHVGVWSLVIIGLVRGLLPRKVAMRGLQVGMVISVLSGYVLLPKSAYEGRFTGFFGDPNVAGLLLVVLGAVALSGMERRRNQVLFAALIVPAMVLAYSRTALMAAVLVFAWFWVGRKLKPIPAVAVIAVVAMSIAFLPTSLQQFGPFSDRTGSDQLRDRVSTQEFDLVSQKPILGHGAGTATVLVNSGTTKFYFHNSYLAAMQEGGAIALGLVMMLLIGTFLALMSLQTTDRQPLLEASIIGTWVMAINLGEVLLELSTAIALGFALTYVVHTRIRARDGDAPPVPASV
jgi:O-antigen ligase